MGTFPLHIKVQKTWACQMEQPSSISDYAGALDIPIEDCLVPCTFCDEFLDFRDLIAFDCKGLQLLWKDFHVYGCCIECSKKSARAELDYFYEFSVTVEGLLHREQKCLESILVRCGFCLKKLSFLEKVHTSQSGLGLFHRVRNSWKGICWSCTPSNNAGISTNN